MKITTVEEFLMMHRTPSTKRNYASWLKTCFEILEISPEKYFKKERKYNLDIIKIVDTLQKGIPRKNGKIKPYTDGSIRIMVNVFKNYCEINGVTYQKGMEKNLNLCSDAVTQDKVPTKEEFRQIVSHLNQIYRAPFLIDLSSWLRLEDVFGIRMDRIQLDKTPARFRYYCRKIKKENMIGFFTQEAVFEIREWLKVRDIELKRLWKENVRMNKYKGTFEQFLNESPNINDPKRTPRKDLLFPYNPQIFCRNYNEAMKKCGLDEKDSITNRRKIHFHCNRKYGDTWGPTLQIHDNILDLFLGHKKGLHAIYCRLSDPQFEEQVAKEWMKMESLLTLSYNEETMTLSRQKIESEYKSELTQLKEQYEMVSQQLTMVTSKFAEEYVRNLGSIKDVPSIYPQYKKTIQEIMDKAERRGATPEQIRKFEEAMKKLMA